jgi:copper chaperone
LKHYNFKTNINCSGCVAKVTPHLNESKDIKKWKVDTNNPGKVLTVETENLNEQQVKSIVEKAGFKAERLG